MADFDISYDLTKGNEGGYANVANDTGGVTYAGITYKNFPHWEGWAVVMSKPRHHGELIPELAGLVKEFYRVNFWNKIGGDNIPSQPLADQVFDMAVTSGVGTALKLLKES